MAEYVMPIGTTGLANNRVGSYVFNSACKIWNTSSNDFETYAAGNVADYDIQTDGELGATGIYKFTVPSHANFVADRYSFFAVEKAGATMTETDIKDNSTMFPYTDNYDGTNWVRGGSIAEIAAAVWVLADGIETGVTPKQALQRVGAGAAGLSSGARTGTETFTGLDGLTDRIQATVDASGNRTAITYDP